MRISTFVRWASLFLIAGLVIPLFQPSHAIAGVKVKEKTTYYYVRGRDGRNLNASMMRAGQFRIRQKHAVAATETQLDFGKPEIVMSGKYCRLKNPQVILSIKYIYPKWPGYRHAKPDLKKRWDKFYRELVKHEKQHAKIARRGANKLDRELQRIKINSANGCNDFAPLITKRLEAILTKTAKEQRAFDQREYGKSSRVSKAQLLLYEAQ